jgi:hypothetical protein
LVFSLPASRCNSPGTQQQPPQQLSSTNKTELDLVHQEPALINPPTTSARSAKRSAKPSLVTFFGFGKKVTRLSAGTDGFDLK